MDKNSWYIWCNLLLLSPCWPLRSKIGHFIFQYKAQIFAFAISFPTVINQCQETGIMTRINIAWGREEGLPFLFNQKKRVPIILFHDCSWCYKVTFLVFSYVSTIGIAWREIKSIHRLKLDIFTQFHHWRDILMVFFFWIGIILDIASYNYANVRKTVSLIYRGAKIGQLRLNSRHPKCNILSNASCFYMPIVLKLLIIVQMWKHHEEGN